MSCEQKFWGQNILGGGDRKGVGQNSFGVPEGCPDFFFCFVLKVGKAGQYF